MRVFSGKDKSLTIAILVLLTSGCTHSVQLTVKNQLPAVPPAPNLRISAVTKDKSGQQDSTAHLGTAGSGQNVSSVFKVKNGGSYSVNGNLSSGVNVYRGGDKTINSDTTDEVDITKLDAPILDPSDTQSIEATFGQLGQNIGFNPITVQSALGSVFGGLVWYVDTPTQTAETQPVRVIPPSELTGAVDYATFPWPSGHDSKDTTVSTDASIKASASVPVWGSLTASFSANSIYKMHWSMEQFGNVQKNDTVSVQDKINALSQAEKNDICNRLQTDKSFVMYVNQMYVVKSVVLTFQQGNTISSSASLNGGSVITLNGAYDFSTSGTQEAEVGERVVNIQGPTWSKSTMSFCGGAHPLAALPTSTLSGVRGSLRDIDHPPVTFTVKEKN